MQETLGRTAKDAASFGDETRWLGVIVLLAVLTGAGCGDDERPCVRDLDCPFGEICEDSVCVSGCFEDGDCGLTHACIDGACAPVPMSCNDDSLCPFGYRCNAGAHRCERHPDAEWLCTDCEPNRLCEVSADCPGGEPCIGATPDRYGHCQQCGPTGSCRAEGSADSCTSDSQCGSGEHCYRPPCFENAHCEDFGSCSSTPYHEGGRLPGLTRCSHGLCLRTFCAKDDCAEAGDGACPKGYDCFRLLSLPEGECANDEDCAGERVCRYLNEDNPLLFCTCLSNADCTEGECDVATGACITASQCLPFLGLTCEEVRLEPR